MPPSPFSDSVKGILRWKSSNWSLCLGAGTTISMLPSWRELSRRILEVGVGTYITDHAFDDLVTRTGWHFDAWIQTALNAWKANGGTDESFAHELENIVYSDLRLRAAAERLEVDLLHAFHDPGLLKKVRRVALVEFFEAQYPQSSALQLARLLAKLVNVGKGPAAILTFSYDTVLATLIRLAELQDSTAIRAFRTVTGPAPFNVQGKVPIYHLHGCLIPPLPEGTMMSRSDGRDSLVAPEESYTQMAGSLFAWPQTTFLHYAQATNMALVGHSLSDPNLRRWLAWSAEVRARESPTLRYHIWLRKRPTEASEAALLKHSVKHLGVWIMWLESWNDIEAALRNLVGLSADEYDTA